MKYVALSEKVFWVANKFIEASDPGSQVGLNWIREPADRGRCRFGVLKAIGAAAAVARLLSSRIVTSLKGESDVKYPRHKQFELVTELIDFIRDEMKIHSIISKSGEPFFEQDPLLAELDYTPPPTFCEFRGSLMDPLATCTPQLFKSANGTDAIYQ